MKFIIKYSILALFIKKKIFMLIDYIYINSFTSNYITFIISSFSIDYNKILDNQFAFCLI